MPAGLRKAMLDLNAAGAELQLIDCVDDEHPNLAIASLAAGARHPGGGSAAEDGSRGDELQPAPRPAMSRCNWPRMAGPGRP